MKIKKLGLIIKKKGILLGTMGMIMALSLTSCGTKVATDKSDNEVVQNEEVEEDNVEENEDKTSENTTTTDSNKQETNANTNVNANTNTNTNTNTTTNNNANTSASENTTSSTQEMNGLTDLTYTSSNLGITFNVPDGWKGKYNVIEEDGKISVYMKHKDNNLGTGLLFVIKKQGVDEFEVLNSIDGVDSVDVNGQTFIVGGPTGYCMEDGDSLIPTYNQMVGECIYPVNSIKAK